MEKILEELGHVSPLLSPIKISSPSSSSSDCSSSSGGADDDLYQKGTRKKRDYDTKPYLGDGTARRNEDASVAFHNGGNATVTHAPTISSPHVDDGGSSKACRLNLSRLPAKCCAELMRKWGGRKHNAGDAKSNLSSSRVSVPVGVENGVSPSIRTPSSTEVGKAKPEKRLVNFLCASIIFPFSVIGSFLIEVHRSDL